MNRLKIFSLLLVLFFVTTEKSVLAIDDMMVARRVSKKLVGSFHTNGVSGVPASFIAQLADAYKRNDRREQIRLTHMLTMTSNFVFQVVVPFGNMLSHPQLDPTGHEITADSALLVLLTLKGLSLRDHLLSHEFLAVGNERTLGSLFAPGGFWDLNLEQNNGHFNSIQQSALTGVCNVNEIDEPFGSNPNNPCWKVQRVRDEASRQPLPLAASAGLYTAGRNFSRVTMDMGTNRRAIKHSLKAIACTDLEELRDPSIPDIGVRADLTRAPGGSINTYNQVCKSCHAGLDPMSGAFTAFNWDNFDVRRQRLKNYYLSNPRGYTSPNGVHVKINFNQRTPGVPSVTDDRWSNPWSENPKIGFRDFMFRGQPHSKKSGRGPASMGALITNTVAFESCMPQRAFELICNRKLSQSESAQVYGEIAQEFKKDYSIRTLFAATASHIACVGGK